MRDTNTFNLQAKVKVYDNTEVENRFVFNKEIELASTICDDEGWRLSFHRAENGSHIVFTKDLDGTDVAIEHTADGGKIFHLSEDSKGLPAMHEFKADGTEIMYLLDESGNLEKLIETKANGDKITTWYCPDEMITQEQRQNGGIVFRVKNQQGSATIWLKIDGSIDVSGDARNISKLQSMFEAYLDGVEI